MIGKTVDEAIYEALGKTGPIAAWRVQFDRMGSWKATSTIRNHDAGYSVHTKRHPQMHCGWRNLGAVANNYLERQKPLASKADCIGRVAQPQTNDIRGFQFRFAMMISFAATCSSPTINAPKKLGNFSLNKGLAPRTPSLAVTGYIRSGSSWCHSKTDSERINTVNTVCRSVPWRADKHFGLVFKIVRSPHEP